MGPCKEGGVGGSAPAEPTSTLITLGRVFFVVLVLLLEESWV